MIAYDAMTMARKFRDAEERVSQRRGGFYLFGLFERERKPGRWDLVISAPWLNTDYDGTGEIIALLRNYTEIEDWNMIASVFPFEASVDYVRWFTQRYDFEHQIEESYNAVFNGLAVPHAFVISATPSPAPAPAMLRPVAA